MDSPSTPDKVSLGNAVAVAWGRSTVTARVLLVAWALLPFAVIVPTLVLKATQDTPPVAPPSRALNLIQRQRLGNDAEAKRAVAALVPVMRACGKRTRDFTQCTLPEQLAPYGADLSSVVAGGSQPGKSGVIATLPKTYSIQAVARTGGTFAITLQRDGTLVRTCNPPGIDGCPASGTW
jgi:hypothetical protein